MGFRGEYILLAEAELLVMLYLHGEEFQVQVAGQVTGYQWPSGWGDLQVTWSTAGLETGREYHSWWCRGDI